MKQEILIVRLEARDFSRVRFTTKNRCRKLQDSFNMYEQKVKDLENFKKQVEKSFWYNFINIK